MVQLSIGFLGKIFTLSSDDMKVTNLSNFNKKTMTIESLNVFFFAM